MTLQHPQKQQMEEGENKGVEDRRNTKLRILPRTRMAQRRMKQMRQKQRQWQVRAGKMQTSLPMILLSRSSQRKL